MKKKYVVKLSDADRKHLQEIVSKGTSCGRIKSSMPTSC